MMALNAFLISAVLSAIALIACGFIMGVIWAASKMSDDDPADWWKKK